MPQEISIAPRGLFTFPNTFSEVPPGALSVASNVVIDRESVVTTRRGFKAFSGSLGASVTHATTFTSYQNGIILHKAVTNKLAYDDALDGTFTEYSGTYSIPSSDPGSRIRFTQANKNLYFTTSDGVKKLDSITATPTFSGAPQAFGGTGATTGASGFMTNNTNVAYQIVWGIKDQNDNLILGVPSERIIVSNSSGGTRNVSLTFQIPPGITTSWFYQVYRSNETATLADIPDSELQQVYENNPTAGEITAASVTITDSVPNDLKQATIYTAPSQQGTANANYQPPFAEDVVTYKNQTFYANTRRLHSTEFTLISVGGTGLVNTDTVTFTVSGGSPTFTLTGAGAENAALGQFQVFTGGTPAQNIENTARSLIRIMNTYPSNTFLNGYYISGFDELPGQMRIERRALTNTFVAITSNRGNAFTPILPSSGTTVQTDAEILPNRIYISKFQQPESVPLYRTIDVGSADEPIQRILSLRDGVFVLKNDGLFRISGDTFENFRLSTLDNTVRILAPNSAVVLANQVFFFSDQGIVAASDTGVAVVSRPIESTLLTLSSSIYTNFTDVTFAIGYESDRKYILFTVTETDDVVATQAFVYNTFTNSWTTWDRTQASGFVNSSDNKMYLSEYNGSGAAKVFQERKNFTRTDFADAEFAVTIVSSTGTTVVLASTTNVSVGMTLVQGVSEAIVEEVVSSTNIIVNMSLDWTAGAATVYQPIETNILTVPVSGKDPLIMKHFQEVSFLFSDAAFTEIDSIFSSDLSPGELALTINSTVNRGSWGLFPWGTLSWGSGINPAGNAQRIRTLVPREKQRANWLQLGLSTDQAFTSFSYNGFALSMVVSSTRMR